MVGQRFTAVISGAILSTGIVKIFASPLGRLVNEDDSKEPAFSGSLSQSFPQRYTYPQGHREQAGTSTASCDCTVMTEKVPETAMYVWGNMFVRS
ncbi:hypothetical protein F5Y15DRAFT_10031 [Xylariaceae sp. FL0016]|nr:hypothetical protein F5Y15DRAFT_10031 [Xylariaceae sp. FL0016]